MLAHLKPADNLRAANRLYRGGEVLPDKTRHSECAAVCGRKAEIKSIVQSCIVAISNVACHWLKDYMRMRVCVYIMYYCL